MKTSSLSVGLACILSLLTNLGCDENHTPTFKSQLQNPAHMISHGLLALSEPSSRLSLAGEAVDFGRLMRDGKVDFALVTPSLTRLDLLNFDLSTLISPEFDQISVVGQSIDLPSNIALPEQVENYSIVTIRLNKPSFKTFVKNPGSYTFSALHGQFPVKQVVDDFRSGKSVFEILNHFNFMGAGQIDAQVNNSIDGQNISVNQLKLDQQVSVTAPQVVAGQLMFSLSLSEVNGSLSPVDLKRVGSLETRTLKVSPLGNSYVLSALVEDNPKGGMPEFNRMSLTLLPNSWATNFEFLEFTDAPAFNGKTLKLSPPALSEFLQPVAIYVNFSEVRKITSGSVDTEEKTVLWESWNDGFQSALEIPEISYEKNPNREYRFEVLYLAKDSRVILNGSEKVDQVTHISRSIVEVGAN